MSFFATAFDSFSLWLCASEVVQHVQQEYSWDCGIACVKMVVLHCIKNEDKLLEALCALKYLGGGNKPLWTIELFAFLREYGVDAEFFSKCLDGVSSHHKRIEWYRQTEGVNDSDRIAELFLTVRMENWPIAKVQC